MFTRRSTNAAGLVSLGIFIHCKQLDVCYRTHQLYDFVAVFGPHKLREVSLCVSAASLASREKVALSRVLDDSCLELSRLVFVFIALHFNVFTSLPLRLEVQNSLPHFDGFCKPQQVAYLFQLEQKAALDAVQLPLVLVSPLQGGF